MKSPHGICVVVGVRPNIVKQAPLIWALEEAGLDGFVLHSGQHFSDEMDAGIFRDLELPAPRYRLQGEIGGQPHGAMTGRILEEAERVFTEARPSLVLVGGDSTTDFATALAARKLNIAVGHVEAGLRSFDWRMPEEHNRKMIDAISELLFAPTATASARLVAEKAAGQVFETGSTTVDVVRRLSPRWEDRAPIIRQMLGVSGAYGLLTLHRQENVDDPVVLASTLRRLQSSSERDGVELLFPAHPRTAGRLASLGLGELENIRTIAPLSYLDFIGLLSGAGVLVTDSGGAQQEACLLRVPCVTVRPSTEWVETVEVGANRLASTSTDLDRAWTEALSSTKDWSLPFGDGHSGEAIMQASADFVTGGPLTGPAQRLSVSS